MSPVTKKKDHILLQDQPVLNCTNVNSFKVVSGDLHQCKTGPELTITAAGMTIKNNKKRFRGTKQEFHKLSMNERTVLRKIIGNICV